MFFWFVGGSWVLVWAVLQDPAVDYRLVMLGALTPDLVDGPFGGPRALHSLTAAVLLLGVVMGATVGRRRLRRRLLALPIGVFVHLLLDGMWTDTGVFWWPFRGWSLSHASMLPSFAHPLALTVAEEVAGLAGLAWCVARFGLALPERRSLFVRTGHLSRDVGQGRRPPPDR